MSNGFRLNKIKMKANPKGQTSSPIRLKVNVNNIHLKEDKDEGLPLIAYPTREACQRRLRKDRNEALASLSITDLIYQQSVLSKKRQPAAEASCKRAPLRHPRLPTVFL